jgi:hypothetical protein
MKADGLGSGFRRAWGKQMGKLTDIDKLFEGRHFDREVIVLCVRWYLRYKLSLRDLVEMMSETDLSLAHTTIMRWVKRFTPEFVKRGFIFTERLTGLARRLTSGSAPGAMSLLPRPSSRKRSGGKRSLPRQSRWTATRHLTAQCAK